MEGDQQTPVGVGCHFSTIGAAVDAGKNNIRVMTDTVEDTIVVNDNLKIFISEFVNVTFTERYAFIISGNLSGLTIRGRSASSTVTLSRDCLMISPVSEDQLGFVYLTKFRLVGCGNNIITGINTTIKNVTFCGADWFDLSSLGTKVNVSNSLFKVKVTLVCSDNDQSVITGNTFESWVITDGATHMTFDNNFVRSTWMINAGPSKNCTFSSNRFYNSGMTSSDMQDCSEVGNIFEGTPFLNEYGHPAINRIPRERFIGGKNVKKAK